MTKILKMQEDPCFGTQHQKLPGCMGCFIRQSCLVCFRNQK